MLFTAAVIPREPPKSNDFWSKELATFLRIDDTNLNCIKARIVLLISTFHATVCPQCRSVQTLLLLSGDDASRGGLTENQTSLRTCSVTPGGFPLTSGSQ